MVGIIFITLTSLLILLLVSYAIKEKFPNGSKAKYIPSVTLFIVSLTCFIISFFVVNSFEGMGIGIISIALFVSSLVGFVWTSISEF